MPVDYITIFNRTSTNLSITGDGGKPSINIGHKLGDNSEDVNLSDIMGNVLFCDLLSAWITKGKVEVKRGAVILTAAQVKTFNIGGDMSKSDYDADDDDKVDVAESIDDGIHSATASDIEDAITKKHIQDTCSYLVTPVTKVLYVDKNRMDIYVENGSITKPYKSFANLLTAGVPSVSVVKVAPGYYSEDVDFSGLLEVTIIGNNTQTGDGTRIVGTVTINDIITKIGLKGIRVQPSTDKIALDYVDGDNCYFQDCVFRNPVGGAVQPVVRLGDVASGGGLGVNTPRFYNCFVGKDGAGIIVQGVSLAMISFVGGFIDADISMIGAYGIVLDGISGSSIITHNVGVLAITRSQINSLTSAITATPATAFLSLNQVTLRANDGVTVGAINLNGTCPYVMGLCDYNIMISNFGAGARLANSFDCDLLNTSSVVGNSVRDALNNGLRVYKQDVEPVLDIDDASAIWIDTNDMNRTYLIFRRGVANHVKIEMV